MKKLVAPNLNNYLKDMEEKRQIWVNSEEGKTFIKEAREMQKIVAEVVDQKYKNKEVAALKEDNAVLRSALTVAIGELAKHIPRDGRVVSELFIALASVSGDCDCQGSSEVIQRSLEDEALLSIKYRESLRLLNVALLEGAEPFYDYVDRIVKEAIPHDYAYERNPHAFNSEVRFEEVKE